MDQISSRRAFRLLGTLQTIILFIQMNYNKYYSLNHYKKYYIHFFYGILILCLFIFTYFETLTWMFMRYTSEDSYYSHGFLIPFISGFLVWLKKDELKNKNISLSWLGILLIIGAILTHLIGTILYIFSISGFSMLFLITGICLFVFGNEIFRMILFPIFFLIFMFPVPQAFIILFSFPMKKIVTEASVIIINLIGIPALREGFYISIPAGELVVGNPCSGLRSMIAFLALGALFAYVGKISLLKKWLLFFSAIPAAIMSNIIRVLMLILVSHVWGISAASPDTIWHSGTGVLIFILALLLMFGFAKILGWKN